MKNMQDFYQRLNSSSLDSKEGEALAAITKADLQTIKTVDALLSWEIWTE